MATDVNQTIRDSRKAAMSFLDAAKAKEERRGPQNTAPQVDKTAVRKAKKSPTQDFLDAARRNEARATAKQNNEEADFDIAQRVRQMSDEDFNKAVADGALTPEQIRRAGEYEWDIYMGDVWSETDAPETQKEPTYEEFMADPAKYGAEDVDYGSDLNNEVLRWGRYNPERYKKQ